MKVTKGWMLVTLALGCLAGQARAEIVYGGTAGDGGDALETTFHFQEQNIGVRMTKPDGAPLSQSEVPAAYGQAFKIFSLGEDWLPKLGLRAVGADLSGGNWSDAAFPALGQVAVDPASGRCKFAAPNWEPYFRLNSQASAARSASVAINRSGLALCARFEQGPVWHGQVFVNAYDPVSGWQGAMPVDAGTTSLNSQAFVALNDSGLGLCLFSEQGSNARLLLNTYQAGAGWQGAVQMNPVSAVNPASRGLTLNHAGQAALLYQSANHLYARTLDPASGWSTATPIDFNNRVLKADIGMAMNASGQIACAYSQSTNAYFRLYVTRFEPGGGWTPPTAVDAGTGKDALLPAVAINADGTIACAFQQEVGLTNHEYVNFYLPGSGWQGATVVETIANTTLSALLPFPHDILLADDGHAVCAYPQVNSPTTMVIYARDYWPGAGWQTPQPVVESTVGWVYQPRLAAGGQGRILCGFTYLDLVHSVFQAASREYSPAAGWGPIQNVGPVNTVLDELAMNDQGFAVAGLRQDPLNAALAYGQVFRVERPQAPVTVNYAYQSITATAVSEKSAEVTGREIKPLENRKASVVLALDQAGWVSVEIYSLRGDRVRTLANAYYAAGRHTLEWGGENDQARTVASGVYVIRIKAPGLDKKQKVVVVK